MSEQPNAAAAMLDQLTDEQIKILFVLEPHWAASRLMILRITGLSRKGLDRNVADLSSAGLVEVHNEPQYTAMQTPVGLTAAGREAIEHRLDRSKPTGLMRVLGFPRARKRPSNG